MEKILEIALPKIVEALPVILPVVLGWVLKPVRDYFKTKTKNETALHLYDRVEKAVTTAVLAVEQTYVREIREKSKDGVLTSQEKDEAKRAALDEARRQIGPELWAVFVVVIGKGSQIEAERALSAKIEAAVLTQSREILERGAGQSVKPGVGQDEVQTRAGAPQIR